MFLMNEQSISAAVRDNAGASFAEVQAIISCPGLLTRLDTGHSLSIFGSESVSPRSGDPEVDDLDRLAASLH
jgi:hypothetical protein